MAAPNPVLLVSFFLLLPFMSFGQVKTKKYDRETDLVHWPEQFNPDKAGFFVYNDIDITAPPEIVWRILVEATEWHTFYKGAEEPVVILDSTVNELKNNVSFRFKTMGIAFVPTIKEFVPNERMAWEINTKKLQAYHAWLIVPTAQGCRLITPEAQNGFLTVLQKLFQPNKLLNLHEHWLEVIKARAENNTQALTGAERAEMNKVLNSSLQKFNEAIEGLSPGQCAFKPGHGKWTIAECIEHVTLAELEFKNILEAQIQKPANPAKRAKIRIEDNAIRPKMTSKKWKARSPEVFRPANRFSSVDEALATFHAQRKAVMQYIETTNDDLRNRFWRHPLTGTIDLYQTLLLMSAHLERHTEQIDNIKKDANFPAL